jgi:ABC-type bacteriocin/lantibiotic exporter with double-glycine peptidase domain
MDEATSHLDSATEQRVLDGIAALGITAISVTHRADVVQRASRVIQLPG